MKETFKNGLSRNAKKDFSAEEQLEMLDTKSKLAKNSNLKSNNWNDSIEIIWQENSDK